MQAPEIVKDLKKLVNKDIKIIYRKNFVKAYKDLYDIKLPLTSFVIVLQKDDIDGVRHSMRMIIDANITDTKYEKTIDKIAKKINKAGGQV